MKFKLKLFLMRKQLSISKLIFRLANILDNLALKLEPSPILVKLNKKVESSVCQIVGPSDAFSGKTYFTLYMDSVDFAHELGNCETKVYDSLSRLKEYHGKCYEYCGVTKFQIKILNSEEVIKQDLFNSKNLTEYKPKGKKNARRRRQSNDAGNRGLVQVKRTRKPKQ